MMRIQAPAKLNLFLELHGKLASGYHQLETVMAPISWYDTLEVERSTSDSIELRIDSPLCKPNSSSNSKADGNPEPDGEVEIPTDHTNLVVRAAERLRSEAGLSQGLRVRLIKRIPAQAGLGGGSSDAAATLLAANRLWGLDWSIPRLAEIAAEIGSDVPFFLYRSQAICRGRGELIEPIGRGVSLHVAVFKPPVGLATPDVFRQAQIPQTPRSSKMFLETWDSGRLFEIGQTLFNRLAEPAQQLTPWIQRLESSVRRTGSCGFLLSGSGSACFALYPSAKAARRAAVRVRAELPVNAMAAHTLAC